MSKAIKKEIFSNRGIIVTLGLTILAFLLFAATSIIRSRESTIETKIEEKDLQQEVEQEVKKKSDCFNDDQILFGTIASLTMWSLILYIVLLNEIPGKKKDGNLTVEELPERLERRMEELISEVCKIVGESISKIEKKIVALDTRLEKIEKESIRIRGRSISQAESLNKIRIKIGKMTHGFVFYLLNLMYRIKKLEELLLDKKINGMRMLT